MRITFVLLAVVVSAMSAPIYPRGSVEDAIGQLISDDVGTAQRIAVGDFTETLGGGQPSPAQASSVEAKASASVVSSAIASASRDNALAAVTATPAAVGKLLPTEVAQAQSIAEGDFNETLGGGQGTPAQLSSVDAQASASVVSSAVASISLKAAIAAVTATPTAVGKLLASDISQAQSVAEGDFNETLGGGEGSPAQIASVDAQASASVVSAAIASISLDKAIKAAIATPAP